ncbi:NERD domain-containing protein [Lutibacter sp. B2]|nr:NERD domain-containing protein [Lutibacter sp. B2]
MGFLYILIVGFIIYKLSMPSKNNYNKKESTTLESKKYEETKPDFFSEYDKMLKKKEESYQKQKLIGDIGEKLVKKELEKLGDQIGYHEVLHDLNINATIRKSIQIDHIVVSEYGIFVIETKHYSGNIYGHVNDEYWNVTYPSGKSAKLYNPIKQNESHVTTIALKSGVPSSPGLMYNSPDAGVCSIVVFTGSAKLNIQGYSKVPIIYLRQLIDTILNLKKKDYSGDKLFNKDVVLELVNEIRNGEKSIDEQVEISMKRDHQRSEAFLKEMEKYH